MNQAWGLMTPVKGGTRNTKSSCPALRNWHRRGEWQIEQGYLCLHTLNANLTCFISWTTPPSPYLIPSSGGAGGGEESDILLFRILLLILGPWPHTFLSCLPTQDVRPLFMLWPTFSLHAYWRPAAFKSQQAPDFILPKTAWAPAMCWVLWWVTDSGKSWVWPGNL